MNPLRLLLACLILSAACSSVSNHSGKVDHDEIKPIDSLLSDKMELVVCSFNIKFLGLYTKKDYLALADLLKSYDLVLIQELVSPPASGLFPDGTPYEADKESKAFVDAMISQGFAYVLSSEDTGTGDKIHNNGSATEWFIAFYKPKALKVDESLYTGFLAEDRSNHPSYERVPHAFSFKTINFTLDFTVISVHLKPGSGPTERARRAEELTAIHDWIKLHNQKEKDFLIVGDMNIYKQQELLAVLPPGYRSLNEACVSTTVTGTGNPYDQVMYSETYTSSDLINDFQVIDLVESMRPYWKRLEPYPEGLSVFFEYYSDHHPVVFTMISDREDDD